MLCSVSTSEHQTYYKVDFTVDDDNDDNDENDDDLALVVE